MHLDEGIEVPHTSGTRSNGAPQRRRVRRELRQSGPRQAGSWREGGLERRSRPRTPEGRDLQAVRASIEMRITVGRQQAPAAVARPRADAAIALIRRRAIVVAALLTLALLSYNLMVLFPQQVDPLTLSSFTLPTVATGATSVPPEPAVGPAVKGAVLDTEGNRLAN